MSKIFLILLVTEFAEWANGHHSNDYHFDSDISVIVEGTVRAQHPGLPHSDQLHVGERLVLDETGDSFELTMVFEDALYFTDQLTETRMFEVSDEMPQRYNCTH